MSALREVRRRLAEDSAFYESVLAEPAVALEPYTLTGREVLMLSRELDAAQRSRALGPALPVVDDPE